MELGICNQRLGLDILVPFRKTSLWSQMFVRPMGFFGDQENWTFQIGSKLPTGVSKGLQCGNIKSKVLNEPVKVCSKHP